MRVVLFDIDGTLLLAGKQVRWIFRDALVEVFGTAGDLERFDFAGRTDPGIVLDLTTAAGIPEPEARAKLPRMREVYTASLERSLRREEMRLLPGVVELLERLQARPDVTLGLLTGNWEPGAWAKLSRFGLERFFSFGAFGCDAIERNDLTPVALERAEAATGRRFLPEEALIIGDTKWDVACARAHRVPALGVATGHTKIEQLREAGADWAVPDLTAIGEIADLGWLG